MEKSGIKHIHRFWRRILLFFTFFFLPVTFSTLFQPLSAEASGEIAFVRAPEQIPAGDDVTILVSVSARETNIDRTLALEFPDEWKLKRAWRVEAGSDHAVRIAPYSDVTSLLSAEPGHAAVALADYSEDFDSDADGMAYFIVFSTAAGVGKSSASIVTLKAALIERPNQDAPPEIDPKTKKPIAVSKEWRMVFPTRYDFSFKEITSKRLMASIEMETVPHSSRALVLEGKNAMTTLRVRPDYLKDYFQHPFSLSFWFRTTGYDQDFLRMQSASNGELRIGTGVLGQVSVVIAGKNPASVVAAKSMSNDGAWHNLTVSKDSLGVVRLFLDAGSPIVGRMTTSFFKNIVSVAIGDSSKVEKDFSIDEFRMLRTAYRDAAEFERGMITDYRDTSQGAFAIFHFDDFSTVTRSSVAETAPMYFPLDSSVTIQETTSPVEPEPTVLSVELISPTTVNVAWHASSELGVKQYILERRIGGGGPFEKVLAIESKHGTKTPKRGQPMLLRATYRASENLPTLKGDIDLYYRIAIVGFNEKEPPLYTYPVKLDYAPNRDIFVEQNEPNPFNPATTLAFRLTKPETVRLSIFDMFGRQVTILVDQKLERGRHSYPLDATGWPQGIYFYKVQTSTATVTRKMVLLR